MRLRNYIARALVGDTGKAIKDSGELIVDPVRGLGKKTMISKLQTHRLSHQQERSEEGGGYII